MKRGCLQMISWSVIRVCCSSYVERSGCIRCLLLILCREVWMDCKKTPLKKQRGAALSWRVRRGEMTVHSQLYLPMGNSNPDGGWWAVCLNNSNPDGWWWAVCPNKLHSCPAWGQHWREMCVTQLHVPLLRNAFIVPKHDRLNKMFLEPFTRWWCRAQNSTSLFQSTQPRVGSPRGSLEGQGSAIDV